MIDIDIKLFWSWDSQFGKLTYCELHNSFCLSTMQLSTIHSRWMSDVSCLLCSGHKSFANAIFWLMIWELHSGGISLDFESATFANRQSLANIHVDVAVDYTPIIRRILQKQLKWLTETVYRRLLLTLSRHEHSADLQTFQTRIFLPFSNRDDTEEMKKIRVHSQLFDARLQTKHF